MFEKKAAYPVTEPRRVAFIGLGVMGYPMAGHLLAAGHSVTVYNRTTAKADKWVKEFGGSRALTPKEAASGADVVFACVGNDDDLRSVILGENAGLDMKTVLKVIEKGAAGSWQMSARGTTMLEDRFDFGFAVDWMRKDLGIALAEARRNGSSLPVTALVDSFYGDVQALGGNRFDTSSLIKRLPKKK